MSCFKLSYHKRTMSVPWQNIQHASIAPLHNCTTIIIIIFFLIILFNSILLLCFFCVQFVIYRNCAYFIFYFIPILINIFPVLHCITARAVWINPQQYENRNIIFRVHWGIKKSPRLLFCCQRYRDYPITFDRAVQFPGKHPLTGSQEAIRH